MSSGVFSMDQKGLTLLEIISVLAIIGILSIMAVPDLSAFTERLRLETTVRDISTDLREMKMRSLLERREYTISFYPEDRKYELGGRIRTLPPGIRFGFGKNVLGPPANPTSTPDADGITFPSNRAIFHIQGSNSMGTIYIVNGEERTMAVSMSITGRVRIWRWTGKEWQ